jgi:tetratricopeptide (TPR) repeat protein
VARSRFKTLFSLCAFEAALLLGAARPPAASGSVPTPPGTGTIDVCSGPAASINPHCNGGLPPGGSGSGGTGTGFDPNTGDGAGTGTGTSPPPGGISPIVRLPSTGGFIPNGLLNTANPAPGAGQAASGGVQGGGAAAGTPGSGVGAASAPSVTGFHGEGSALAIKAGVELQLGDLAAACIDATAALKENPKDAKAAKIESLACRVGLASGPKGEIGDGLKPGGARDVTIDANSRSKLLRRAQGGGTVAPGPGALQAWLLRISEVKTAGDDAQVILLCDEALREFPGNVNLLDAKATAQNKLKDFRGALATALEALDMDPNDAVAWMNKAFALRGLGDRDGMLAALRAAAALDPRFEAALKAALAEDAAGLFGDVGRRKPIPKEVWIAGSAAAGFLVMLVVVLLARRSAPPPATELAAPPGPKTPRTIGRGDVVGGNFRIDGELGRGGMGVVFDAFDQRLERRVAIKQLQRDANTTQDDRARFLREARLVAQLKHPNLAEIYTVLDEKGEHLLVFEFVDGRTLDKVIYAARKLPLAQAGKIIGDIAAALDYAHGLKIIHRDLKPGNVMVTREGAVKVMDFGIAHQASAATGMTRTTASGTPPYMAPEQGMGSVSKAADLYALGVMAYEMVSGARPFDGPDFLEQKLGKTFTPLAQRDPSLPAGLDAFFASALEPDPTKRPASGAAFAAAFLQAAG